MMTINLQFYSKKNNGRLKQCVAGDLDSVSAILNLGADSSPGPLQSLLRVSSYPNLPLWRENEGLGTSTL